MDVKLCLLKINSNFEYLKYLLLATHLHLDKIKDTSKETKTDIAQLRVKLDQVIKEVTRLVAKSQATADTFSTTIVTRCTNLKDTTAKTLAYFFQHHPPTTPKVYVWTMFLFGLYMGLS